MATIYVHNITAFDTACGSSVSFGYSGAQCIKNKLSIYNNETDSLVYENTRVTFDLAHEIPPDILVNGESYYCTITAYYKVNNDEQSITSSSSNVFMCLKTPIWNFKDLNDGSVIGNSYYDFSFNYSQEQNEEIDEYYIVVYTASHTIFWSSGSLYDSSLDTRVTGLVNDELYFIRAYGVTVNGLEFDTRIYNELENTYKDICVSVDYISPTIYSPAYLESNKWRGWVKIFTNVCSIEGYTVSGNNIEYIDEKYADIRNDTVVFDEGVMLSGNFTLEWVVCNINENEPLLMTSDTGMAITFRHSVLEDIGEKCFADLRVLGTDYIIHSNLIDIPSPNDVIHFWVRRNSGLYLLKITNMGVGT